MLGAECPAVSNLARDASVRCEGASASGCNEWELALIFTRGNGVVVWIKKAGLYFAVLWRCRPKLFEQWRFLLIW